MAVVAQGSKFSRNNALIIAVVCLLAAAWFGYDGWIGPYKDKQLEESGGKVTANLLFNRFVPIPLVLIAAYSLASAARIGKRKIAADEQGLTIDAKPIITYDTIKQIDKRYFQKEGHFSVEYSTGSTIRQLKLSDRKYDNLGPLLDELITRTGAAPLDENQG